MPPNIAQRCCAFLYKIIAKIVEKGYNNIKRG